MPQPNSMNPSKGKHFQRESATLLEAFFGVRFSLEHAISIGSPPKLHRFDLASVDGRLIGECKSYCWTEGGNVPSAKIGFINEAVFYLQHLPQTQTRFVILRRDCHISRGSLADYYVQTNGHLLNGVHVLEADLSDGSVRDVSGRLA